MEHRSHQLVQEQKKTGKNHSGFPGVISTVKEGKKKEREREGGRKEGRKEGRNKDCSPGQPRYKLRPYLKNNQRKREVPRWQLEGGSRK
jgi:hypothetical protein